MGGLISASQNEPLECCGLQSSSQYTKVGQVGQNVIQLTSTPVSIRKVKIGMRNLGSFLTCHDIVILERRSEEHPLCNRDSQGRPAYDSWDDVHRRFQRCTYLVASTIDENDC